MGHIGRFRHEGGQDEAAPLPLPPGILELALDEADCCFALFDPRRFLAAHSRSYEALHPEAFATLPRPLRYDDIMRVAVRRSGVPEADVEAEVARRVDRHESDFASFERRYPDGRWMRVSKRRLPGGFVVGFALDITELKAAQARAEHLASHDGLTGLPNRSRFRGLLDEAARGSGALLLVDLDGFKGVNDTRGHAAGDEVLRGAAARLRGAAGGHGVACRLGGDEFAVVCGGALGPVQAAGLGALVVEAMAGPFGLACGASARIGASVGIALADGGGADGLFERADRALYRAKNAGRGRAVLHVDGPPAAGGQMHDLGGGRRATPAH